MSGNFEIADVSKDEDIFAAQVGFGGGFEESQEGCGGSMGGKGGIWEETCMLRVRCEVSLISLYFGLGEQGLVYG